MVETSWLDENGNVLEVAAPLPDWQRVAKLRGPSDPFDPVDDECGDTWSSLCFLAQTRYFKDWYLPSPEEIADLGIGDPWIEKMKWERDEYKRLREEKMARKAYILANPHLGLKLSDKRQKKKGRTLRKRIRSKQRKIDEAYELEFPDRYKRKPHLSITEDYDEHILKLCLPESWKSNFWLISFIDDNRDYKLLMRNKTNEVFWPAEPISKRTLGYELLEFMTPTRKSCSMCVLQRERNTEVASVRSDALNLRRSKSENDLSKESFQWNTLEKKERYLIEEDSDFYFRLIDDYDSQDDLDVCRRVNLF